MWVFDHFPDLLYSVAQRTWRMELLAYFSTEFFCPFCTCESSFLKRKLLRFSPVSKQLEGKINVYISRTFHQRIIVGMSKWLRFLDLQTVQLFVYTLSRYLRLYRMPLYFNPNTYKTSSSTLLRLPPLSCMRRSLDWQSLAILRTDQHTAHFRSEGCFSSQKWWSELDHTETNVNIPAPHQFRPACFSALSLGSMSSIRLGHISSSSLLAVGCYYVGLTFRIQCDWDRNPCRVFLVRLWNNK